MNISSSLISNILREKGYLDFKPFSYGNKEVYCYRTKNESINEFHFCDSDLNELSRDDLGLPSGPIFVLGINDEYEILKEGCDVKDKLSYHKVCLLVDRNNIIRNFAVNGYVKLNENYYVLESSLNLVDDTKETGFLKPNFHNTNYKGAYNSNKDYVFKNTRYGYNYYWSYKSFHILHGDGNYIVLSENKEYIIPSFPEFLITDGEVSNIVYLDKENDKYHLNILDTTTDETKTIEFTPHNLKRYNDEEYVEPPYSGDSQFYVDKNIICVVMQTREQYNKINDSFYSNIYSYSKAEQYGKSHYINSTILIVDKNRCNIYFYGNLGNNRKFISIDNGIISLEERLNITDLEHSYDTKRVYLDLDFSVLAETDYKYHKYIVISRRNRKITDRNEALLNDEYYTLRGVLLNSNKTLVVPIRYECIEIIDEYAIVGNVYKINGVNQILYGLLSLKDLSMIIPIQYCYLKVYISSAYLHIVVGQLSGNGKKMVYGMYCNGKMLMPIKYDEITPICYANCMRYKQRNKYGLLYEGDKFLPARYDKITNYSEYLVLERNNKKGVLSISNKFLSPVNYDNVELIANNTIFIGDNDLFLIKDNKLECIVKGKGRLNYLNSRNEYHMFRSVLETDINDSSNYECHKISSTGNDLIVGVKNVDKYGTIKDEYGIMHNIRNGDYLSIDDGVLYYEVSKNTFYKRDSIFEPDYSSYDDNGDYERDTYYALGGSDYDRFKEEGGDLDTMMEGMGH